MAYVDSTGDTHFLPKLPVELLKRLADAPAEESDLCAPPLSANEETLGWIEGLAQAGIIEEVET